MSNTLTIIFLVIALLFVLWDLRRLNVKIALLAGVMHKIVAPHQNKIAVMEKEICYLKKHSGCVCKRNE